MPANILIPLRWLLPVLLGVSINHLSAREVVVLTSFPESVYNHFKKGFAEKHPNISLVFIHKKTAASLSHIENKITPVPDIFMASAVDAFEWLKQKNRLVAYPWAKDDEPGDKKYYTAFAYSAYGFMWNSNYLSRFNLPAPKNWISLIDPIYQGHIAMSSPTRSGTTHILVETILQHYGWDDGWAYLMQLSGNLATVTARSFGVKRGVVKQRFGIGLVIDFFALSAQFSNDAIEFVYPSPTSLLPVNVGLINHSNEAAPKFINFLMSAEAQKMLLLPSISRHPVNRETLALDKRHPLQRYQNQLNNLLDYNLQLSQQRYHLVNTLFDQMITLRLQNLQAFWGRYRKLEKHSALQASPVLKKQLLRAKQLIMQVPFKAGQLDDSQLLAQFSRHQPGSKISQAQAQLEQHWRQEAEKQFKTAMADLHDLEKQLKTLGH